MVNRFNQHVARRLDELSENESLAVLEYISELLTQRFPIPNDSQANDDLIASLSEKRENARARQVVEWEKTRRRNAPRAA